MKAIVALVVILAVAFGVWKFWPQIEKMVGEGDNNQAAIEDGPNGETEPQPKKTTEPKNSPTKPTPKPKDAPKLTPKSFIPEFSVVLAVRANGAAILGHSNFPSGTFLDLDVVSNQARAFAMVTDAKGDFTCNAESLRSLDPGIWIMRITVDAGSQSEKEVRRVLGFNFQLVKSKYLRTDLSERVRLVAYAELDTRKIKVRRGVQRIKLAFTETMPTLP